MEILNNITEFYKQLNPREVSVLVWCLFVMIYGLSLKACRSALLDLIKAVKPILWVFSLELLYIILCVKLLEYIKFWEFGLLKDTILISFTSILLIMSTKAEKVVQNKFYFWKLLLENFALVAMLQFIMGIYTFPLYIELFLVPIFVIISVFAAFASVYNKDHLISKIFNRVIYIIGFGVVISSLYMMFIKPADIMQILQFKIFILPIIITLMFIPMLYLLLLFKTYEWYFTGWKTVLSTNMGKPEIYKSLRNKVLIRFNFNLYKFFDFYEKNRLEFFNLESQEDVDKLFKKE
jgi:hypothetical protein